MKDELKALLEEIHLALPKELLRKIQSREATASDLNVARQLLKDNEITSTPEANQALGGLKLHMPELDEFGREVG